MPTRCLTNWLAHALDILWNTKLTVATLYISLRVNPYFFTSFNTLSISVLYIRVQRSLSNSSGSYVYLQSIS